MSQMEVSNSSDSTAPLVRPPVAAGAVPAAQPTPVSAVAAALAHIRDHVVVDVLAPANVAEITELLTWASRWQSISNVFEVIAQVLMCVGIVLAFASGFFASARELAFAAGGSGAIALAAQRFAAFAEGEGAERHAVLQRMLAAIGAPASAAPSLTPPSASGSAGGSAASGGADGGSVDGARAVSSRI